MSFSIACELKSIGDCVGCGHSVYVGYIEGKDYHIINGKLVHNHKRCMDSLNWYEDEIILSPYFPPVKRLSPETIKEIREDLHKVLDGTNKPITTFVDFKKEAESMPSFSINPDCVSKGVLVDVEF